MRFESDEWQLGRATISLAVVAAGGGEREQGHATNTVAHWILRGANSEGRQIDEIRHRAATGGAGRRAIRAAVLMSQ